MDTNLLLDNNDKQYVLAIKDMPAERKPREKLIKYGPALLSTSELFAVLLGTGSKKEDVLSMASRISMEYGDKTFASQMSPTQMSEDLDIPIGKAMQIVACAELGRRFFKKSVGMNATIRTAKDVFEYVKDMRELPKEHLRGIYLNSHNKVIHDEVISIGTVNANLAHPREVFRPALEYSAAAIVLAHNHPSGSLTPSQNDIEVTTQLISAGRILGINLLDHVIITRYKYASIEADYN
jgi:DNA repair protein RadC